MTDEHQTQGPPPSTDEQRRQVATYRLFVKILGFALLVTIAVGAWLLLKPTAPTQAAIDAKHVAEQTLAVTNCRGKSGAALSAAQVDDQIALSDLVIALASRAPTDRIVPDLIASRDAMARARDARTAFEANPTGDC